jgi:hypothetical protein
MDEQALEDRLRKWRALSYSELVAAMLKAKEEYEEAKRISSLLWGELQFITDTVIPRRMDEDDIQNITVKLPNGEKKQLLVMDQVSVKTPPDKKVELWEWLRSHGAEHLITETVNSSTLAGFVREQMRQGDDYPSNICEISTYSRASLRKA